MTFLFFVFFVVSFHRTLTAPTTYDQQQTGDLNVALELKNIQIVALTNGGLFDGFGDYEYSYDYSDFTIKPIGSHTTTPSSSTSSVEPWHTWPTVAPSSSPSPSPAPITVSEIGVENPPAETGTIESRPDSESENTKPEKEASSTSSAPIDASVETPASATAVETTDAIANDKTRPSEDPSKEKEVPIVGAAASEESQATASSEKDPTSGSVEGKPEALTAGQKKCNPGSTRDQEGKCRRVHTRRRIPSSFLPFGIRLTPRIPNRLRDHQSETIEN